MTIEASMIMPTPSAREPTNIRFSENPAAPIIVSAIITDIVLLLLSVHLRLMYYNIIFPNSN